MVDHDLEQNEPFIQLTLSHPDDSDLTDKILRHFVSCANHSGIEVKYPNASNFHDQPQIRLKPDEVEKIEICVAENSFEFREWLDSKDIPFSVFPGRLVIEEYVNIFNIGVQWGEFKQGSKTYQDQKG